MFVRKVLHTVPEPVVVEIELTQSEVNRLCNLLCYVPKVETLENLATLLKPYATS